MTPGIFTCIITCNKEKAVCKFCKVNPPQKGRSRCYKCYFDIDMLGDKPICPECSVPSENEYRWLDDQRVCKACYERINKVRKLEAAKACVMTRDTEKLIS